MGQKSVLREYFEALLIAVIFATFAKTYVVQAFKIPSASMEENLLVGDHILVNKFVYGGAPTGFERAVLPVRDVRRGDVVVFKSPEDPTRDFIKRCVALPSDQVEIIDKRLFINGEPIDEELYTFHTDPRTYPDSRFYPPQVRFRDNYGPVTVPEGHYFCLGDNRDNSNDSRFWGPVPEEMVKGRALLIYWSYEADGGEESTRVVDKAKKIGRVAATFFTRTRWERTFDLVR